MLHIFFILASSALFSNTNQEPCEIQTVEGLFNPSSRFEVCPDNKLIVVGDFLLWTAKTGGLYYAQAGQHSGTDNFTFTDFNGIFKKVKTEWDPGFRVGLGYPLSHDEWDTYAYWVHYGSDKTSQHTGLSTTVWAHTHPKPEHLTLGYRRTTQAAAKWSFDYDLLDWEIGRPFWVSTKLSFRPYVGVRGAWIDQKLLVDYDFFVIDPQPAGVGETEAHSNFSGAGPRTGFDLRYLLRGGWSVSAKGAYATLYGRFEADYRESENGILIASADDDFHLGTSVVDMSLGLQWDKLTKNEKFHFGFYAGWEQQVWLDFTHFNHFGLTLVDTNSFQEKGNLSLQGLTVRAKLQF